LQKDYSLGFDRVTPDQGFEIYGGKAHYFNDIHLSHEGLKGKGIFEYLTSVSNSDEIYFFPDSTALFTKEFTLNKVEKHHGSIYLEQKKDQILINEFNKNDVKKILGPPSTKSYFDNETWVYIENVKTGSKLLKLGKLFNLKIIVL
jgi:hypothetical protein